MESERDRLTGEGDRRGVYDRTGHEGIFSVASQYSTACPLSNTM